MSDEQEKPLELLPCPCGAPAKTSDVLRKWVLCTRCTFSALIEHWSTRADLASAGLSPERLREFTEKSAKAKADKQPYFMQPVYGESCAHCGSPVQQIVGTDGALLDMWKCNIGSCGKFLASENVKGLITHGTVAPAGDGERVAELELLLQRVRKAMPHLRNRHRHASDCDGCRNAEDVLRQLEPKGTKHEPIR